MAPLVRHSWHPRALTLVIEQRTRARQKVSVMAALCMSPTRDRVQLYFRLHHQTNLNAFGVGDFLHQLNRQLDAPWTLIWDRLQAYRARFVRVFIASQPHICCIDFAPYVREINLVEYLWACPKNNLLANAPYFDAHTLAAPARTCTRSVEYVPTFL